MSDFDVAVIGGGLVGASIAYGLVRKGRRVVMLDEGDIALRASRGNFGLIWVQGKGNGRPEYAHWSLRSAGLYAQFAAELLDVTGLDIVHENKGGVLLSLTEEEDHSYRALLAEVSRRLGNLPYEYEFLSRPKLEKLLPGIGPKVVSGSFSPHDGHVNPLILLRALHKGFAVKGGQ